MRIKRMTPKSVIFFLIVLYPFLPLNYYIGPLGFVNVCSICIIGLFLLTIKDGRVNNYFKLNPLHWLWFGVFAVFSAITKSWLSGFAVLCTDIVVGLVIISLVKREEDVYKVIDGIATSSFFLGILGIVESLTKSYIFQEELFAGWSDSVRYGLLRCATTFGHPINFALYQAIAAVLIYYRLQNKKNTTGSKRRFLKITYVISLVSMMMSSSRLAVCFFVAVQLIIMLKSGMSKTFSRLSIITLFAVAYIILGDTRSFTGINMVNDLWASLMELLGGKEAVASTTGGVVGFGNRFELYGWVIMAMGGKIIFGLGVGAPFAHKLTDWLTKTSIEVHYLNVFYQTGIVGLFFLILSYLGNAFFFKKNLNSVLRNESTVNLMFVLFIIFLMYYVCLFGVNESDLTRLYCELVSLGIAVTRIAKSEEESRV